MVTELREKLNRFKIKAEEIKSEKSKCFIVDVRDTYYFCDIKSITDASIIVKNFKGTREGQEEKLFWADVVKIEEYKDKVPQ